MSDFDFQLKVSGQCPSGKNAVIVTRAGHRFPSARFVEWRQQAMNEVFPQLKHLGVVLPITHPVDVLIEYTPKDRIRRDAPGIIDSDFRGEVYIILINHGSHMVSLKPGERIAQLVFCPVYTVEFEETSSLSITQRGTNGFGSTGQ